MIENLIALTVGTLFGLVLSFMKLPLPAPNALPGVVAVFGAFFGGEIYKYIATMLGS